MWGAFWGITPDQARCRRLLSAEFQKDFDLSLVLGRVLSLVAASGLLFVFLLIHRGLTLLLPARYGEASAVAVVSFVSWKLMAKEFSHGAALDRIPGAPPRFARMRSCRPLTHTQLTPPASSRHAAYAHATGSLSSATCTS